MSGTLNQWRIERITSSHIAHVQNPREFPVGGWYCTNHPSKGIRGAVEFSGATWVEAASGARREAMSGAS